MQFSENLLPVATPEWILNKASFSGSNLILEAGGMAQITVTELGGTNLLPEAFQVKAIATTYSNRFNPTTFIRVFITYIDGNTFDTLIPVIDQTNGITAVLAPDISNYDIDVSAFKSITYSVFSSEPRTLTLFTFQKSLNDSLKEDTDYFGIQISTENGFSVKRKDGLSEAIFNSDMFVMRAKNAQGVMEDCLYFDPNKKRYMFKGDINMQGGTIFWGDSFPYRSQFAPTAKGPWHNTQEEDDIFRRDSYDSGDTWGTPYQFVGKDGTDAKVTFNNILAALQLAGETKQTFITADAAGAPQIYGGKIFGTEIYAGGAGYEGSRVIGLSEDGITIYGGRGIKAFSLFLNDYGEAMLAGWGTATKITCPYLYLNGSSLIDLESSGAIKATGDDVTLKADTGDITLSCPRGDIAIAASRGEVRIYVDGVTWYLDSTGWHK